MEGKRRILLLFPVVLLPLTNLITAAVTGSSVAVPYTTSSSLIPFLPAAVVFILGAVFEELFYRWFLLKKVFLETTKRKPILSILIVSVLFALMHLWNLQTSPAVLPVLLQVFSAFCFSVWAGAAVWRSGQIKMPLLAHLLLNMTAFADNMWISIIVGFVVLINGAYLLKERCHI